MIGGLSKYTILRRFNAFKKIGYFLAAIAVSSALGQADGNLGEEPEREPAFSTPEMRARPIVFEEAKKDNVIEIEIHRWGITESPFQIFTVLLESQPGFIENLSLDATTIEMGQEDWSKDLELRFDIREPSESDPERQNGDIVLVIQSNNDLIQPAERRFIIPLRYNREVADQGRTIFVTTLREEYTGPVGIQEAHLECTEEEVTLFTIDPIYIFFKGFPEEEQFYYKLIAPNGEEIETMPYLPGEDSGNAVLASMEGAISPMHKPLDELDIVDRSERPFEAGVYRVLASYQKTNDDPLLGEMTSFTDFFEIGTFELLQPLLHHRGMFKRVQKSPYTGEGGNTRITSSAGGSSASIEAEWVQNFNGNKTTMGAAASATFDYPDKIMWTRDQVQYPGNIRISGSSFGQENKVKPATVRMGAHIGFIVTNDPNDLATTTRSGYISKQRTLQAIERDRSSTPESRKFTLKMPSPFYANGLPTRRIGWHLRDPNSLWLIKHSFSVSGAIGAGGGTDVYTVYGPEPGGVAALLDEAEADTADVADETEDEEPAEEEVAETESTLQEGEPARSDSTLAETGSSSSRPVSSGPASSAPPSVSARSTPSTPIASPSPSAIVPEQSQEGPSEEDQQFEEALATANPDLIPPTHPRVAELIASWIGNAEPPNNADPEVSLQYNQWGNLEGIAKSGVITQNYKPDEAGGLSSPEYLWIYRRGLDSLGHCQLGDWVMAELLQNPLSNCKGRFSQTGPIPVPNVVGQSIDEAEAAIVSAGLVPIVDIGPPAPSSDAEGTISKQSPPHGSRIGSGDLVSIEIYTNYVGSTPVPDLANLTIDQAENRLTELSLTMELQLGDPAPSERLQNRIQRQSPSPSANLEPKGSVRLWVYAPYEKTPTFPNLLGQKLATAKSQISQSELSLEVIVDSPAPTEETEDTILRQEPAPGSKIESNHVVKVWIHSPHVPTAQIPDLSGLTLDQAEKTLRSLSLEANFRLGDPAPSKNLQDLVQRQNPPAGTRLDSSESITLWVYAPPVENPTVPNLLGQSIADARSTAREAGLRLNVNIGEEAPNRQQSGRLYRQSPTQGTSVSERDLIEAWFYAEYVETVLVPNLIGLKSNEAELIALEHGLLLNIQSGGAAPTRELAFTIASQTPAANARLTLLQEVDAVVYAAPAARGEQSGKPSRTPFSLPAPSSPSGEADNVKGAIVCPATFLGEGIWQGELSEFSGIANPIQKTVTPRPQNGWAFYNKESGQVHSATVIYGKPRDNNTVTFALLWEENGDDRSKEIICGATYESEYFWDDENWTIGRLTSPTKRATVIFIGPTSKAAQSEAQLPIFLKQIEELARPCN